jgi:DEAD/DEAH box helicase
MSSFDLHTHVLADYRDFVRSFFIVADERARQFVEHALVEEARLWPDSLLQVSPAYARAATVDELAAQSVLHETTARVFRTPEGTPFHLYQHQIEALEKARGGESYVVTSGTGSGKSLTCFLPIVDHLIRQPATDERVAALVVYPMNALVNSQLQALEKLKEDYERRTGQAFPVTFAKYTSETNEAVREALRRRPPQILLTNYVMAETCKGRAMIAQVMVQPSIWVESGITIRKVRDVYLFKFTDALQARLDYLAERKKSDTLSAEEEAELSVAPDYPGLSGFWLRAGAAVRPAGDVVPLRSTAHPPSPSW